MSVNDELLPCGMRKLINHDVDFRTNSPAASLEIAGGKNIADPPESFGVIKPRNLLAAQGSVAQGDVLGTHHARRHPTKELTELEDEADSVDSDDEDPFSSPVGGAGAIGKILQGMLSRVRQLSGSGPPGADTPTHRSQNGIRGQAMVTSTSAPPADVDDVGEGGGRKYPEWDMLRGRYKRDWCTVTEIDAPLGGHSHPRPDVHALRRPLTRLGIGLDRCHRQTQGDDIDVDAAVEARVELFAGTAPDEAVYVDSLRRRRDLAVLVLLDVSGSSAQPGTFGQAVHEHQRDTAAALTVALHELGDRVALFGYQSQGRSAVHVLPVKRFDDSLDALVMQRLGSLVPGSYSRLGAAIRHGTSIITEKAGTSRRMLVVLSDGLAYDHGYERDYGAADARRALAEARRQGIGCLCLTIGAATDAGELRKVFGSAAHASIPKPRQLADVIGPLFRAALRTADLRRKVR
jgi:nitric oxide reductase activation protein